MSGLDRGGPYVAAFFAMQNNLVQASHNNLALTALNNLAIVNRSNLAVNEVSPWQQLRRNVGLPTL